MTDAAVEGTLAAMTASDPEAQLTAFLAKYSPDIAARAAAAIGVMRARYPGAQALAYDNYNALAVGFAPTDKTSGAVFSIAVYPRWVTLFLLRGAHLDDPYSLLKGKGGQVRHIVLTELALLDDPRVTALMAAALEAAGTRLDGDGGRLIIKSVAERQRPRRPLPKI